MNGMQCRAEASFRITKNQILMKHLITIVLFFCFAIPEIIAQSDFRDGYIINNNNDTIYGLIDYRGNKANARRCLYRKDIHAETQLFTPDDILGYRFNDSKYYVSRFITTASDERKQLFLEYLINGIVDVFYYRDDKGEHYLVGDDNDSIYALKKEDREIFINNKLHSIESNEYIGVLKAMFHESPTIFSRVENIGLGHKSLINIALDYHNEVCHDQECIIYEKKLPKFKHTFGILGGMNGMSISQTGEFTNELYYMRNSRFTSNVMPSIGIYYKINMPFINEKLYFQHELTFSRVNLTMHNTRVELSSNAQYLNDLVLTQNVIYNQVTFRYEFPVGRIRPTIHFGAFAKNVISSEYIRHLKIKYSWGETKYLGQFDDNPFSRFDFGITSGLGFKGYYFKRKEFFVDLRFYRGFGFMQGLNTNLFLLNLGFQLGNN
jgi:hypothetical protein